jgi:cobalt-zinc-cadmium resistance protein CzcA
MLQKIIQWSINNKLIVAVFTIGLITWGIFSLKKLPIDAVPDITNNQVQLVTSSPSTGAEDIERFVTFPVEQTMATIPGIEEIRSFSRFGLSVVTVVFEDDVDIYWARQQISERLSEAKNQIPAGFGTPSMAPLSTGLGEIYQYIIKAKKGFEKQYDTRELRTIQDWIVRRQLLGIPGVADVSGFGGHLKQYEIAVDLGRLQGFGLTVNDVFQAVERNNTNTGGAYIERHSTTTYIRTEGLITSMEDLKKITLKQTENGQPVQVKDVASVRLGSAVRYGALTHNTNGEVVGGIVLMLKGANSSEVIDRVKERMDQIKSNLPEGVEVEVYLDRTKLVNNAISTVSKNLLEGAIIVVSILVLFLGNFRAGLLVASIIPLAMLFAISLMNVFGVSGNLMSLGALDFGLIIDGAVIIVESTIHQLYLSKKNVLTSKEMDDSVFKSASKFSKSAVFGQLIILVVYLPLLALVGIEGKMFKPMAQTVMFAILGALILSLTYVPMMASVFLSKNIAHKENFSDRLMNTLRKAYMPLLNLFLRNQRRVIIGVVGLFVLALVVFNRLGAEFIPTLDEGDFAVETRLLTGTSLTKTIETTTKASDVLLKNFPEVKSVVGKIGTAEIPTDPMPMEACDLMVILKDKDEWVTAQSKEELADTMQKMLESTIPGVSFGFQQPIQMRFNELMTGAKQDVVVKIYGEDLAQLNTYADRIGRLAGKIQGVQDVYVEEMTGLPQLIVSYDRDALAKYNIPIEDVNRAINISFAGQATGLVFEGEKRFDLVVKLEESQRTSKEDLESITIMAPSGIQVPLSQLATVEFTKGPNQIQRDDAKRRIIVGFNVRGRDVASIVKELQQTIDREIQFDPGYYPTYGGTFKNLENARDRLLIAVPVSLLLIFFLLYLTFRSMKQAILIFTAIPLATIGGILALWMRGMPFSISAGVGFIALFGIAVLNGIVLIAEFNALRKMGYVNQFRIVKMGTSVRLRPVLLTAAVASLGFLPMAISAGSGAEVQKPLATVVIGGLVSATVLTLFVLPILYTIFQRPMHKRKNYPAMIILIGTFLLSNNALSQQQIPLDECLKLAEVSNMSYQSIRLQTEQERWLGRSNAVIPKTDVNFMIGQYNSYYNRDNNFTISQSIPFPTVFKNERDLGERRAEAAINQADLMWLDLELAISKVHDEIRFNLAKQLELQKQDSLLKALEKLMLTKKEVNEVTKLEVLLVQTKVQETKRHLAQTKRDIQGLESQLSQLVGSTVTISASSEDYIPLKPLTFDSTQLRQHPELRKYQVERSINEQEKKLEKSRLMPDIKLGYVNQTLVGVHSVDGLTDVIKEPTDRFQAIQLGVTIPLFFGSTTNKLKAISIGQERLSLEEKYASSAMNTLYIRTLNDYIGARENVELYQKEVLPQVIQMELQSTIQLESGEVSMLEFLQVKQVVYDAQIAYLETIMKANQTTFQLNWFAKTK